MKNVLFLTYYFPPQTSVGMLRTSRIVKSATGDELSFTVLSVKDPDKQFHGVGPGGYLTSLAGHSVEYVRQIPTKYTWQIPAVVIRKSAALMGHDIDIKKLCRLFWYVDMEYGWILPSVLKAIRLASKTKFDGILVSAPPFSSLVAATLIKRILNIPLIADYRDAWTFDTYSYHSEAMKRRERKLLKYYDHMIVTSWSDYENYSRFYDQGQVSNITNGIERALDVQPVENDVFTILYTGSWGTFRSSPTAMLQALKECDFKWRLLSVPQNSLLEAEAERLGVKDHIQMFPRCRPEELVQYFSQADLLFITKGTPKYGSQVDTHIAAKLYDYCASGRPILGELPEGDSLRFMNEYASTCYHAPPGDISELKRKLVEAHEQWREHKVVYSDMSEFSDRFLSSRLSAEIVDVVKRVVGA